MHDLRVRVPYIYRTICVGSLSNGNIPRSELRDYERLRATCTIDRGGEERRKKESKKVR